MRLEHDAFEEGAKAAGRGIGRDENPYDRETHPEEHAAWDDGWGSIDPDDD